MLNLGPRQEPPVTPPTPGWITVVDKAVPAIIAGILLAILGKVNDLNESAIQVKADLKSCLEDVAEIEERVGELEKREIERRHKEEGKK